MDRKVKLGIIGIGNMGTSHAKNILDGKCPDLDLVAVADCNEERVVWGKEQLSTDITYFDTAEDMLDSGLIEACLVATPHYDHPKYAIECMKRGIHVMVEKPAGVYTKQAKEMNEEAAKHPEVVFGMMFNQRTNCVYRKIYELVHSGKYGEIRRTNWFITTWYRPQAYYDSGSWRATWVGEGGGVLLNQCPHQLDMWQWICGMPKKVCSHIKYGKWHDIEVEDDVTTWVEYENGATGVFITSTGDAWGTNRFEIQMDKAKIVSDYDQLTLIEYEISEPEFSKTNTEPFGQLPTREVKVELDGKNEQHVGVLNAWAGAILRGEPLVAKGEEGINAILIAAPHPLHAQIAMEAFERGKHVLTEKPVDVSVGKAEQLNRAAEKSGKIFGIMFNQRTNSLFQKARQIVQGGELGELKRSVWIITNWYRTQQYYDSGSWRATWKGEGGGVLLNQAPHNLDLWQWICGMPDSVTAFCNVAKYHEIEVEDEATIYVTYPNGATGVFITTTGECPGTNRLEISGTKGKLVLENGVLKHWKLKADEREVCKNSKQGFDNIDSEYMEYTHSGEAAHKGILQNFANAVLYGEKLLASGYEGINELTISNAAYLSEWMGNQTIRIPFNAREFDLLLHERIAHSELKEVEKRGLSKGYSERWQVRW